MAKLRAEASKTLWHSILAFNSNSKVCYLLEEVATTMQQLIAIAEHKIQPSA